MRVFVGRCQLLESRSKVKRVRDNQQGRIEHDKSKGVRLMAFIRVHFHMRSGLWEQTTLDPVLRFKKCSNNGSSGLGCLIEPAFADPEGKERLMR